MPRTGSKTPPVNDCSSSWLLWHDEKTTSDVKTTNGPDPRSNVVSIRDQHSTGLGSVITAYTMMRHDELSRSWVTPMSCFHAAPSAPKFTNVDRHRSYVLRTTIRIQLVLLAWLFNQNNIDWWHWMVASCPHTTQPTTQASPPQGNYHLSAVESP